MKKLLSICLSVLMLLSVCPLALSFAASPTVAFDVGEYVDGKTTVALRFVDCVGLYSGSLDFAYPDGAVTKIVKKNGADAKAIGDIDNAFSSEFNSEANPAEFGFYFKNELWDSATWQEAADEFEQDSTVNGESFEAAVFTFTAEPGTKITVTGELKIGRDNVIWVSESFVLSNAAEEPTTVKTEEPTTVKTEEPTTKPVQSGNPRVDFDVNGSDATLHFVDCVGLTSGEIDFSYQNDAVNGIKKKNGADVKAIGDIDNAFSNEFNGSSNPARYGFYFKHELWDSATWQEAADEIGQDGGINGEYFEAATFSFDATSGAYISVSGYLTIAGNRIYVDTSFNIGSDAEPTTKAPIYEEPTSQAPAYEEPTTKAPAYEVETTQAPVYEEPMCDHVWDGGVDTKPATESAEGERVYTCTICGEFYTEITPKVAVEQTGAWCEGITYTMWNNGKLVMEGTGALTYGDFDNAWEIADRVRTLVIGEGITSIDSVFESKSALREVTLPKSMTAIGGWAFQGCPVLENINGGENVAAIGNNAFGNTPWYDALPDGPVYIGKVLYEYKGEVPEKTAFTVKAGTEVIADRVFNNCLGLTKVTLPKGLVSIGEGAFFGCANLAAINSVETVTQVGANAFGDTAWLAAQPQGPVYYGKVLYSYKGVMPAGTELTVKAGTTAIGPGVFQNRTGLVKVTLPDTVTEIAYGTFAGCTELKKVTLPKSVASIGAGAFSGCTALTACATEADMKTIGDGAKVILPNTVTSIVYNTFAGCSAIKEVTLPKSVASIDNSAFANCAALESVSLPTAVKSIGYSAFRNCPALSGIVIPDSVEWIGGQAFADCTALKSAKLGSGLRELSWELFRNCTSLTEIAIPGSIEYIGSSVFDGCESLAKVSLTKGLVHIWDYAFRDCKALKKIVIPSSVRDISPNAFVGCTALETLEVNEHNPTFYCVNNCVIDKENNSVLMGLKDCKLPTDKTVTAISGHAFAEREGLTEANIPNNINAIGDYAYAGCKDLAKVTLPDTITDIVYGTFADCPSLKSITIPKSVESINATAFSGCTGLETLTVAKGNANYYSKGNCVIEKETGTLTVGCPASKIPDDGSVKRIGNAAFSGQTGMTFLAIPEGVEMIEYHAFYGCDNLSVIQIPASVTEIEYDAIPKNTTICGVPGSAAQLFAEAVGRNFMVIDRAYLTLKAPTVVNEPTATLSGYATIGTEVTVSVNGKEASRIASADGKWSAAIPLTSAKAGDSFKIEAKLTFNGKTVTKTATVAYQPDAVVFRSLTLNHSYYTANVTAETLGAAAPNFTFIPGVAMSFVIEVTNSERIDTLYVASIKDKVTKKMPLTYNKETGIWTATGFFEDAENTYVPGDFRIKGTDKDGKAFDAGVLIRFNFLVDPSGYVYEAVQSNVVEGATAAIYYKDKKGNELLWNAASAEQINPITTLADGAFAWVVPEGKWQVRVSKDGYETACSDWLDVPPEQKNVYIPIVTRDAPLVSSVNVYADHADILFDQYMDISSVNAKTVVFNGYTGKFAPVDKTETAKGSGVFYAKCFRFTPTQKFAGEVNVKCIADEKYNEETGDYTYTGPKNYAGITMRAWRAYSATVSVTEAPKNLTAPETAEVLYGETVEIEITAENAAGKTITVAVDNALITFEEKTLQLDKDGKAKLVVTGAMPGTAKLTFTLEGTKLAAATEVTVALPVPPGYATGDVNNDGKVGADDARLALRASVKLEKYETESPEFVAADVNGNGAIGADDARTILRVSVKLESFDS